MSRHGTPTSELGKLRLEESSRSMPTTRAMGRQNQRQQNLQASQRASTRTGTGPSSSRTTRPRPGQQQMAQASASREAEDDSEDGSDSDGDDDDSDEEVEGSEQQPQQQRAATSDQTRAFRIVEMLTAFDHGLASPIELAKPASGSTTRTLALAIHGIVQTDADLQRLLGAVPVPGPWWSQQMATNMESRYARITHALRLNRANGSHGTDLPDTIAALRRLFVAVDSIRQRNFTDMDAQYRARFGTLLIDVLDFLVGSGNQDIYAGRPTPSYAGEGFQSSRRVLSSFVSDNAQSGEFIGILRNFAPHLRHERQRIQRLNGLARGYATNGAEGETNPQRLNTLAVRMQQLLTMIP